MGRKLPALAPAGAVAAAGRKRKGATLTTLAACKRPARAQVIGGRASLPTDIVGLITCRLLAGDGDGDGDVVEHRLPRRLLRLARLHAHGARPHFAGSPPRPAGSLSVTATPSAQTMPARSSSSIRARPGASASSSRCSGNTGSLASPTDPSSSCTSAPPWSACCTRSRASWSISRPSPPCTTR
ncbi:hypothetical protein VPH35_014021 [Triticum aestivum]